jgi:hypothetical protein
MSGYGPGRRDYEADVREDAARAKRQPIGRLLVETIDAAVEQEADAQRRKLLEKNSMMISGTLNQTNMDVTTDEAERILRDLGVLPADAGASAIAAIVRQDELGAPTPEPKKAHRLSVTKYDGKADYPYRAECICGWKGISHKTPQATRNSQQTHAAAYGFTLEGK